MAKMTAKQKRFCDEYLIDLNATQAAIRAGYSEKNARNIGCENLAKPNIKDGWKLTERKTVKTVGDISESFNIPAVMALYAELEREIDWFEEVTL